MYITCPKCDTKFAVTAEQIGEGGKKVKCSRCSHIWHQTINNRIKVEPILTPTAPIVTKNPFENGVNLPALLPLRPPLYLYTMPLVLASMIIFILVMLFPGSLEQNFMFGNDRVNIQDVHIDNQKDAEKIIVSYKVHNSSDKKIPMPLVRIRLLDKNNRVLQSRIVDQSEIDLAPWQDVLIEAEFYPAPPTTWSVDIMIGNKLDFILW